MSILLGTVAIFLRPGIPARQAPASLCCGHDDGSPEMHIAAYRALLERDPRDTVALIQLGRAYLHTGHYEWSKLYFDSAALVDSSSPRVAYGLAYAHMRMGHFETSALFIPQAGGWAGDSRSRSYFWGEWYRLQGLFDTAAAEYAVALAAQPLNACTLNSMAINFKQQGRLATALMYLDSAVMLAPREPMFLANRYYLLLDLGRDADADRDLEAWRDLVGGASVPEAHRSFIPGREPYGPF